MECEKLNQFALEDDIKKYDIIFLVCHAVSIPQNFMEQFFENMSLPGETRKIKVLSEYENMNLGEHVGFEKITLEEEREFLCIWFLYEFSDRFRILSESTLYGGLQNYVKTGLLTWEEVSEAFLK